MKNTTKLEKVKQFLDENNIKYEHREKRRGQSDIWIRKYRIAIKIDGDDREEFYQKHKKTTFPVFICDCDTPKFVIEKVQTTIIKSMMRAQRHLEKKEQARQNEAECMRLHEEKLVRKAAERLKWARKRMRKRERIKQYEKIEPTRRAEQQ